jgi:hypothetical protein
MAGEPRVVGEALECLVPVCVPAMSYGRHATRQGPSLKHAGNTGADGAAVAVDLRREEGQAVGGAVMRYDRGYPVDETRQCVATTTSGRQCKNRALVQGSVQRSDGTTATVTEAKCALHGGQAAAVDKALRAAQAARETRERGER